MHVTGASGEEPHSHYIIIAFTLHYNIILRVWFSRRQAAADGYWKQDVGKEHILGPESDRRHYCRWRYNSIISCTATFVSSFIYQILCTRVPPDVDSSIAGALQNNELTTETCQV